MVAASPQMQEYFTKLTTQVKKEFEIATQARQKGFEPEKKVEISLAENMAERVVGLISVVAPQIVNSGVTQRIIELEAQYGLLDWRVALVISREIAEQKFCLFPTKKEAMEVGIRTGFAYVTVGVVSSPLDGIINIEIKKRMDGKEYICVNFAGPIRNAGGTAAAVSVIITDYVRAGMGYEPYDAQQNEIKRAITELQDYHERVTNLQYVPSEEETTFLMSKIPVEVSGDPSEKIEVSNYKDIPRIPTNNIRSGYCLVLSSCIPLKAPKLWKQLSKWGKDFKLESWNFLEEFLNIQKKAKSGKTQEKSTSAKILPDYTYIKDLVAGRPVLGHPLRPGAFRLRYGRSRTSGFSAQSIHPATMHILNQYIACGTQLKTERPGKAASMTSCDLLEGPIVKLDSGDVLQISTLEEAKKLHKSIREILFLGDTLISYGDFFNRAHNLVPAGYCPEWWALEVEKAIQTTNNPFEIPKERIEQILNDPLRIFPKVDEAIIIAKHTKTPLHPKYTYYWNLLSSDDLSALLAWIDSAKIHTDEKGIQKIVLPLNEAKRLLELSGIPHLFVNKEFIVLEKEEATIFAEMFSLIEQKASVLHSKIIHDKNALEIINNFSPVQLRDKSGIFIGTRMGRPEKAKQRLLTGNPHVLFPVGEEGGRMRSFQSAFEKEKVTSSFAYFYCTKCQKNSVLTQCLACENPTERRWKCGLCGLIPTQKCEKHGECKSHEEDLSIPIKQYFDGVMAKLGMRQFPELVKGVRGTSNKDHVPEHLAKGIFRANNNIHVYKDGTTRYDMTQLPITHFKPIEVGTAIEKLKEIGYVKDIKGDELTSENQILELKPQDIILPNCDSSPDEGAGVVLTNIAKFVDDCLEKMYGLPKYYSIKKTADLVGHLTIVLAPHTSAGIVGRIIGFTKTQGLFAHPLLHASTRRDCDGDEACVILLLDAFLNFSKQYLPESRGSTMDTPLVLTSILTPSEVDDMAFDLDIAWKYPLEFYEASLLGKAPWDVKIPQIKERLTKPDQYENMGFTHDITNLNETVPCSAYKTIPSMEDKLKGQMDLAERLRCVDTTDVARLVIEKHFIKDTKGNLRKFSMQQFRCVGCNEKFRRPPLIGKCTKCKGKIIFTISEGSVLKYLEPTMSLAKKYNVSPYLLQTIELLQFRVQGVFGKDAEKQTGLGSWFQN